MVNRFEEEVLEHGIIEGWIEARNQMNNDGSSDK